MHIPQLPLCSLHRCAEVSFLKASRPSIAVRFCSSVSFNYVKAWIQPASSPSSFHDHWPSRHYAGSKHLLHLRRHSVCVRTCPNRPLLQNEDTAGTCKKTGVCKEGCIRPSL